VPASQPTTCRVSPSRERRSAAPVKRSVCFRNGRCPGDLPPDLHPARRYGALDPRRTQREIRVQFIRYRQRLHSVGGCRWRRRARSGSWNLHWKCGNRLLGRSTFLYGYRHRVSEPLSDSATTPWELIYRMTGSLTPKLTVNLGLRWQLFTPIYEIGNRRDQRPGRHG